MRQGIDTNVLLRAAAADDTRQTPAARRLLADLQARGDRLHVNLVVLVECSWVMDRSKRMSRAAIADWIDGLLANRDIDLAERDAVAEASGRFRAGRLGFADALIGVLNRRAGCATTWSFDQGASGSDLFSAVPDG